MNHVSTNIILYYTFTQNANICISVFIQVIRQEKDGYEKQQTIAKISLESNAL